MVILVYEVESVVLVEELMLVPVEVVLDKVDVEVVVVENWVGCVVWLLVVVIEVFVIPDFSKFNW